MHRITRRQCLVVAVAAACEPRLALASGPSRATAVYPTDTSLYASHYAADALGLFKEHGLDLTLVHAGGGTRAREILASGQVDFAVGDITHPLQLINRGRPARILYPVDRRAGFVNILVRRDLYDAGATTLQSFVAREGERGAKPVVAVSSLGGAAHVYASYVLEHLGLADKVSWLAGGSAQTMLGGLQTKRFDAIVCVPAWQFEAEERGWGRAVYDVRDGSRWIDVFGGEFPVTAHFALKTTIDHDPKRTEAYVRAVHRAQLWLRGNSPEGIYDVIGERFMKNVSRDAAVRELAFFKDLFEDSGAITARGFENGSKVWFRPMTDIAAIAYENAVEPRFMSAVRR